MERLTSALRAACVQDKDMAYWQVDFPAIRHRCSGRGVVMARHPFPDFNAEGLRHGLPSAVALLDGEQLCSSACTRTNTLLNRGAFCLAVHAELVPLQVSSTTGTGSTSTAPLGWAGPLVRGAP